MVKVVKIVVASVASVASCRSKNIKIEKMSKINFDRCYNTSKNALISNLQSVLAETFKNYIVVIFYNFVFLGSAA